MRRMPSPSISLIILLPLLVLGLFGCGPGRSFQKEPDLSDLINFDSVATERFFQITIESEDDLQTRAKIAADVVNELEPGLKDRVAANFPGLKPWQIDTLSIFSRTESLYSLDTSSWMYRVYIEISLNFSGDEGWTVLQFCADEVNAAIARYP